MRTLAVIIIAGMLALGIASNANASDRRAINDAARLHSASLDFAAQLRYLGGSNSLRGDAEKLSREASRLRSAMHAGYSGRQLQARYDELVKYYYRFERNYQLNNGQRNNFGYRFESGFRNVNLAFHSLNSSYLYAWNSSNRHYSRGFESYGRSNTVDIHIFNNRNFDDRRYDNNRYDNNRYDNYRYDDRRSHKYDDRRYNSWDRSRRSQDHRRDVHPQNHYKGSAGSYGDRRRR